MISSMIMNHEAESKRTRLQTVEKLIQANKQNVLTIINCAGAGETVHLFREGKIAAGVGLGVITLGGIGIDAWTRHKKRQEP